MASFKDLPLEVLLEIVKLTNQETSLMQLSQICRATRQVLLPLVKLKITHYMKSHDDNVKCDAFRRRIHFLIKNPEISARITAVRIRTAISRTSRNATPAEDEDDCNNCRHLVQPFSEYEEDARLSEIKQRLSQWQAAEDCGDLRPHHQEDSCSMEAAMLILACSQHLEQLTLTLQGFQDLPLALLQSRPELCEDRFRNARKIAHTRALRFDENKFLFAALRCNVSFPALQSVAIQCSEHLSFEKVRPILVPSLRHLLLQGLVIRTQADLRFLTPVQLITLELDMCNIPNDCWSLLFSQMAALKKFCVLAPNKYDEKRICLSKPINLEVIVNTLRKSCLELEHLTLAGLNYLESSCHCHFRDFPRLRFLGLPLCCLRKCSAGQPDWTILPERLEAIIIYEFSDVYRDGECNREHASDVGKGVEKVYAWQNTYAGARYAAQKLFEDKDKFPSLRVIESVDGVSQTSINVKAPRYRNGHLNDGKEAKCSHYQCWTLQCKGKGVFQNLRRSYSQGSRHYDGSNEYFQN